MEHRLEQGPLQGHGVKEHQAKDHIGDLADGGVGQALFQGILPHSQGRPQKDRDQRQHQHRPLRPAPIQERPAKQVVRHPDEGQHSHFGDQAGQHRRGGRRGHRVGDGQPGVEGKHPRLTAEAHRHHEEHRQQQPTVLCRPRRVQHTARSEQIRGAEALEEEQPQQSQTRPGHREAQIAVGGVKGLSGPDMEHQWDGQQGHHLIEQVEGHQVARQTHPHQRPQGQQVEPEKAFPVPLVVHVLKGKKGHCEPHRADQLGKQAAQRVRPQHEPHPLRQGEEHKGLPFHAEHRGHHQQLDRQQQGDCPPAHPQGMDPQHADPAQHGQQNGQQQPASPHGQFPPPSWVFSQNRDSPCWISPRTGPKAVPSSRLPARNSRMAHLPSPFPRIQTSGASSLARARPQMAKIAGI